MTFTPQDIEDFDYINNGYIDPWPRDEEDFYYPLFLQELEGYYTQAVSFLEEPGYLDFLGFPAELDGRPNYEATKKRLAVFMWYATKEHSRWLKANKMY